MKVYFEDGQLLPQSMLPFKYNYKIDAANGYSCCEAMLRRISENDPKGVIYTNMITALSNFYAWDEELKAPEIYMRDDFGKFVRIDKLMQGKIRRAQNVLAMYRAGVFGNIPLQNY